MNANAESSGKPLWPATGEEAGCGGRAGDSRQRIRSHVRAGERTDVARPHDSSDACRPGGWGRLWLRLGAATLCFYALEGAAGLPVFANFQAGLFLPTGEIIATGGYIIGFILAAWLVGWLAERGWDRNPRWIFLAMLLGGALLYVPGLIWLTAWFVELKGMALDAAIVPRSPAASFPSWREMW